MKLYAAPKVLGQREFVFETKKSGKPQPPKPPFPPGKPK